MKSIKSVVGFTLCQGSISNSLVEGPFFRGLTGRPGAIA